MTLSYRSDSTGGAILADGFEKLVFDAAGNVTFPAGLIRQSKVKRNFFGAYLPNNYGVIPLNTWTLVRLYTEIIDSANTFEPTTGGRFQPNVAGWYQISAGLTVSGGAGGTSLSSLYRNNIGYRRLGCVAITTQSLINTTFAGSFPVYFNGTTDYVDLRVYTNMTDAYVLGDVVGEYTTLSGYLIEAD